MGAKDQCRLTLRAVSSRHSKWLRNCLLSKEAEANMVITTLLMICSILQMDEATKTQKYTLPMEERTKLSEDSPERNSTTVASAAMPLAPETKIEPGANLVIPIASVKLGEALKPATRRPKETPRQRKMWLALSVSGHAGAGFDAWSTRRAITSGAGSEANPLLRPFSHSNLLYPAMQASPFLMDFLGRKMMTSPHKWLRKLWWLPQAAGAGSAFAAGGHNVSVGR
jgi:hypothetical protein